MKSITQKRNEAYERAQARAKLSTEQKLNIAMGRCSEAKTDYNRECRRLAAQLKEERARK